jgi:hypothetical protein
MNSAKQGVDQAKGGFGEARACWISAAAEVAFFLALSLVPFVGIAIALAGHLPVGMSASIAKVLRDVLPAESPVAGDALRWARSSASKGLADGRLPARALELISLHFLVSSQARLDDRQRCPLLSWTWRTIVRSLLLLAVWMVALVATALFLLVTPSIEHGLLGLPALSDASSLVFSTLRVLLVPGILFGAIWLTYRAVAGRRVGSLRVALVRAAGLTRLDRRQPGILPRRPHSVGRRAPLWHARQSGAVPDVGLSYRLDPPARRGLTRAARVGREAPDGGGKARLLELQRLTANPRRSSRQSPLRGQEGKDSARVERILLAGWESRSHP